MKLYREDGKLEIMVENGDVWFDSMQRKWVTGLRPSIVIKWVTSLGLIHRNWEDGEL